MFIGCYGKSNVYGTPDGSTVVVGFNRNGIMRNVPPTAGRAIATAKGVGMGGLIGLSQQEHWTQYKYAEQIPFIHL